MAPCRRDDGDRFERHAVGDPPHRCTPAVAPGEADAAVRTPRPGCRRAPRAATASTGSSSTARRPVRRVRSRRRAGGDRCGARAEPSLERDAVDEAEAVALDGRRERERAQREMRPRRRGSSPAPSPSTSHGELAGARPRARSRGRAPRRRSRTPGRGSRSSPARSRRRSPVTRVARRLRGFEHGVERRRRRRQRRRDRVDRAVSFSPWPVRTQTTVGSAASSRLRRAPRARRRTQARRRRPRARASSSQACAGSRPRRAVTTSTRPAATSAVDLVAVRRLADPDRGGHVVVRARPPAPRRCAARRPPRRSPPRSATVLPPPPYGSARTSGARPSCSTISNDRRLLALDAVGVERVDEHEAVALAELAAEPQRVVEAAAHLEHAARRPRAPARASRVAVAPAGVRTTACEPGARGVGGRRRGGVAGRRADDGPRARLDRARDRDAPSRGP